MDERATDEGGDTRGRGPLFRALAELSADAVFRLDDAGTVTAVSPELTDLLGEPRADVEGAPFSAYVADSDLEAAWRGFERVRDGEVVRNLELALEAADGSHVVVAVNCAPVDDGDDGAVVQGILRDVTERRAHERDLELKERVLDAAPIGITIADATADDEPLVYANEGFERLTGYPADAIVGDNCRFLQGLDTDPEQVRALREGIDAERPVSVELLNYRADGEPFWNQVTVAPVADDDGEVTAFVGFQQDVTDRVSQERELERQVDLFEKAQDIATVGAWEYDVRDEDGWWTAGVSRIFGFSDATEQTMALVLDRVQPDDRPRIADAFERAVTDGDGYDVEVRIERADGQQRWVRMRGEPQYEDGELARVRGTVQDVTDRRRHAQTLTVLNERSREMARAEDRETIMDVAVSTTESIPEFDGAVVYEFDGADGLVPMAWSEPYAGALDDQPVRSREDCPLWGAFTELAPQLIDADADPDSAIADLPASSAVALPVGNHGVLLAATRSGTPPSTTAADTARLVGDNLNAALDRADRERRLRERDRTLRRRNDELEQLDRLNRIIRRTTQAVVQSPDPVAIATSVCERFAAATDYEFAWFGSTTADGDLSVEHWAEMDPEYVNHLASGDERTALHELVAAAQRDCSVQVVRNVLESPAWQPWRQDALRRDYRSVAVVPVVVGGEAASVLVIYGATAGLFDDREQAVLSELGYTVGYALENTEAAGSLGPDDATTVEVSVADERVFSTQLAATVAGRVELVGAIPVGEDDVRAFVRVRDAGVDDVAGALASVESVDAVRGLSEAPDGGLYQLRTPRPGLLETLRVAAARVPSLTATAEETTLSATVTGDGAVRSLLEDLSASYDGTELRARHEDPSVVETYETFRERVLGALTEKQLDALRTALYGGYYERPRESTSAELAATRDVAPSTFQYHLRAAEGAVVEAFLDGDVWGDL